MFVGNFACSPFLGEQFGFTLEDSPQTISEGRKESKSKNPPSLPGLKVDGMDGWHQFDGSLPWRDAHPHLDGSVCVPHSHCQLGAKLCHLVGCPEVWRLFRCPTSSCHVIKVLVSNLHCQLSGQSNYPQQFCPTRCICGPHFLMQIFQSKKLSLPKSGEDLFLFMYLPT